MRTGTGVVVFVVLSVGLASAISLIGGIGIELVQDKLLTIVPLLIALPALNSMVGDYATLIAAHAGNPAERTRSKRELISAMAPSLFVSTVFVIAMSLLLANRRGYPLESEFIFLFTSFVATSILVVVAAIFVLTVVLDKILVKHRLNPDDLLIPVVTTITDIFMLGLIALATVTIF